MKITDMEWLRRNRQPLWVFALYFVSIAGFGGVYWRLYYTNNANFWFNEDIYKSQYSAARNLYEREFREEAQAVALLTGELDAVNTVDSDFRKGLLSESADREGTTVRSPSGYIMRLQEMIIHSVSGGPAPPAYRISISDPKGKLITNEVISILEQPNTTETLRILLAELQDKYQKLLAGHTETLSTLSAARGPTRIWSYWDFFYFSMMTQTTVAFGDMLPNTTAVRMVVCVQVFLGCLLLIVIINWYFPSKGDLLRRE
ncbi:MAG: potassium channel family protein [Candidatus Korobacteraceae bacterium]